MMNILIQNNSILNSKLVQRNLKLLTIQCRSYRIKAKIATLIITSIEVIEEEVDEVEVVENTIKTNLDPIILSGTLIKI